MGHILPFPRSRDRRFILRHAARVAAAQSGPQADRHLANQLGIIAATMTKRGFPRDVIKAELEALENAVRAELWRAVLTPGGAA